MCETLTPNTDLFKIVVRVDVVPDGHPVPPVIENGREHVAYFTIDAKMSTHAVMSSQLSIVLPDQPEALAGITKHALEQCARALGGAMERPADETLHVERRRYYPPQDGFLSMRVIDHLTAGRTLAALIAESNRTGDPVRIVVPGGDAAVLLSRKTWEAVRTALNIVEQNQRRPDPN